ncbi:hypothetical protein Tco_0720165 [Tanacetum coccineum]
MSATRQGMSSARIEHIVTQRIANDIEAIAVYETKIRMAHDLMDRVEEPCYVGSIIPLGVEEVDHDIEVAHMDNNPYVDFPIPEPSSEESSTQKFTKGIVDPTLFVKREGKDILLMSMMGKLSFFLGLQISQSHRGIFLIQSKYALESLKKYGMETCEPVDTSMVEKSKLDEDLQGKVVDPTCYRRMIGTLMYLTSSRPDLVFAVCMCAWYQEKPTEKNLHAVKRIFRYLKGTINMGLWYSKDSYIALTAFTVADHTGC